MNFPGLPIPQNSPKEVNHPTPPKLQILPSTIFFSVITSPIEQVVQHIISPSRENQQGIYIEGNILDIPIRVEFQNLTNIEESLEDLNSLEDTSI